MIRHEDILINYALFNTAKSYKFIGKYGIFNYSRDNSASKKSYKTKLVIYYIYILDIAIDFVIDREDNKKILINLVLFILKQKHLKKLINKNSNIRFLFSSCIKRVLTMKNIKNKFNNRIRIKLIENFNQFIF